jgi:8-oxo-dGTP pyrophosphatase MutT (NUDIX family)
MRIFVNDLPFEFVPAQPAQAPGRDMATFSQPSSGQIWKFYEMARDGQVAGQQGLRFEVGNYEAALEAFQKNFLILEAAGGIVRSPQGMLFIFRLQKWDLPKGKLEAGEAPEQGALREVEEECGVQAQIAFKVGETWHTYRDRRGRDVLKCTHWFAMDCLNADRMAPQTEEDIQALAWVPESDAWNGPLQQSYASIRHICEAYFQHPQKT